jgi:hypothetical protein
MKEQPLPRLRRISAPCRACHALPRRALPYLAMPSSMLVE